MLINARKSAPAASALSRDRFAPRLRPATIVWLLDIVGVSLNPCKVMTAMSAMRQIHATQNSMKEMHDRAICIVRP
ncbi:MAG: hypothetical protein ACRCVA_04315 [Phreatobacter sp.]